jgi:hypothetical protein
MTQIHSDGPTEQNPCIKSELHRLSNWCCYFIELLSLNTQYHFLAMEDFSLVMLVLFIDITAVVVRISAGEWTIAAKLSLLATHLALISQVLKTDTSRMSL